MLRLVLATLLILGVIGALATAQTSVPTVAVTAGKGSIALSPTGPIAAGPTRFTFARSGRGQIEAYLATLRAGVSVDELRQVLSSRNSDRALGMVFLEASATPSDPASAVTVDLRPDVTYLALSLAGRSAAVTSFTTGARHGATAPAPDARIRMVDYSFRGPKRLPRDGLIRVSNEGTALHFALAFPLKPGVTTRQAGRALRAPNERALGRIVAGEPLTVQNIISPGSVNDSEIRFPRRGRYAFVCFFGLHEKLGMYKVFRVR